MSDGYNVNGFDKNQNYELQIKNRGKRTGITFEFQEDLQKYIDEGVFIDELNNGFTNKEKKNLAETFLEIHKEKGYSTNFGKMRKDTKFTYTADEYIRLAKAAGYVLKDMTPAEQAMLKQEIERSASQFANNEPDPELDEPVASNNAGAIEEITIATAEPVSFSQNYTPDFNKKIDIKPVEVPAKPPEDDPFKLSENDPLFAEIKVERVNIDELPEAEPPAEEITPRPLPKTYLKRLGISPEQFEALPLEEKSKLYQDFALSVRNLEKAERKANRKPLLTRIFGSKKAGDA